MSDPCAENTPALGEVKIANRASLEEAACECYPLMQHQLKAWLGPGLIYLVWKWLEKWVGKNSQTTNDEEPTTARLAARRESASLRHVNAQIFIGIDRRIVDTNFVVKMRPGAPATQTYVADRIAAVHMLPGSYRKV